MFSFKFFAGRRDVVAVFFFLLFYIFLGVYLYAFQERMIYYPDSRDFISCPEFAEAEKITHRDTRMYFKKTSEKIAVFYHGNAGSTCDRSYMADILENYGYSYLFPEYAGYSGDTRVPTNALLRKDVENTADFLKKQNFFETLIIGESIGSGPASYHVSFQAPEKLILITPFTSLVDIAKKIYWFYPVSLIVKDDFKNMEFLANYGNQALIIHGAEDKIISPALGRKVFKSIPSENKEIVFVPGVGHNDLFAAQDTFTAIYEFLKK